jgi:choline monooxygenase
MHQRIEEPRGREGAFCSDASRSWTLPSRYYLDAEIAAQEQERIFQRSWCYVAHVSELPQPGSYLTDRVAGQPVLLLRDREGEIRAFYNVCRHRAHLLLGGCGTLKAGITCPYHAWSYALDGRLKGARLTDDVPGFDKADFSLRALGVSVLAGLVFVHLDREAQPLVEQVPGFEATLLEHLPELRDFALAWRLSFDIKANWKVCVDNFSEAYHIPVAHPELARLHGGKPEPSVTGERFACYRNIGRGSYAGFPVREDEPYLSWTLWPNHCLLSLPGTPQLIMLRMTPDGPGRCIERADILAPAGAPSEVLTKIRTLFAETFNPEDIAIVENVQQGLASLGYDQGRYVVDRAGSWFSESALHHFHSQVLAALA